MKNILLILNRIDKQTIEHLSMSAISGFLISLYLVFSKDVVTLFKENFFLGFALIFLTISIMSYYIQNLRKYFLRDKFSVALFLFVGTVSYVILK